MDIDMLAKMVKEAILDHDTVTLPGVGSFVAELVPSTFSDKGYTINPPYRRLYFSPKQGSDTLLADLYARDNAEVDVRMSTRILTEFLAELKEVLKVKKTVVFPGLGRLRATRENHFFFVADEDLDIYPEGLGLAPLSLKTHVETPEEVATAVAGLADLIAKPEDKVDGPVAVVEEIPGQAGNDGKVDKVDEPVPAVEEIPGQAGNDEQVDEPKPIVPEPTVPEPTEPEATKPEATEPEPIVPEAAQPDATEPEAPEPEAAQPARAGRRAVRVALIVLGVAAALLVVCAILGRVAPGLLDPLLYSKEELEILRY